jgi:hypothetical protein
MSTDWRLDMKTRFHPCRAVAPLVASTALAVAAAGCGGKAETLPEAQAQTPPEAQVETLSKAEVIGRASAICLAQEAKVRALPQLKSENPFAKNAPEGDREKAQRFLAGYADALETVRTQLGQLALPDEDKEKLEGFIEDLGPTVERLREAERAASRNDPRALTLANEAFGLFEEASKQTAAYGFPKDVCGA